MSAPAYFKDAADYHDWWFFSGTALGAASPGETFKMLHEQLSEAGANTVRSVSMRPDRPLRGDETAARIRISALFVTVYAAEND